MMDAEQLQIPLPLDDLRHFCEKWGIVELAVFGSITRPDFHEESDIDFLMTFGEAVRRTLFDLVEMEDELKVLLGREVDLIDRRAIEQSDNYIRRREILGTAKVIYVA